MTYTILLQSKPGYCAGDLNNCAYPLTTAIHVAKNGEQLRWYSCDVHAKLKVYARFRAVIKFEALTADDVARLFGWGLTPKEVPMPTRVAWGRKSRSGAEIHVVSAKIPAECSCRWRVYHETREGAIKAVERHLAKAVEVDFQPRRYNAETRLWEDAGPSIKVYDCVGSVGREAEHEEQGQAVGRVRPALNKEKPRAGDNIELPARRGDRGGDWLAKCGTCGEVVRLVSGKYANEGYLVLDGHWLQMRHQDVGIGYAGDRCPGAYKRARKPTKQEKAAWKEEARKAQAERDAAIQKMKEVVKARADPNEGLCTCDVGAPQLMQESAKVTRYVCGKCGGYFDRISERAIAKTETLQGEPDDDAVA